MNKKFGSEAQEALLSNHPLALIQIDHHEYLRKYAKKEIPGCSAFQVDDGKPQFTRSPNYTMRIHIVYSEPDDEDPERPVTLDDALGGPDENLEADADYIILLGHQQLWEFSRCMARFDYGYLLSDDCDDRFPNHAFNMQIMNEALPRGIVDAQSLLAPFSAHWRGLHNINVVGVLDQRLHDSFMGKVTSPRWTSRQEFLSKLDALLHEGEQLIEAGGERAFQKAEELGHEVLFLGFATLWSDPFEPWFHSDADYATFSRRNFAARRIVVNAAIKLALLYQQLYLESPVLLKQSKVDAQKYAKIALWQSKSALEIVEDEPHLFTEEVHADLQYARLEANIIWEEYRAVLIGVKGMLLRHPQDGRFRDVQRRIEDITGRSIDDPEEEIMGCPPS